MDRQRGCSTVAVRQLPKLVTRVRFPSPAPFVVLLTLGCAAAPLGQLPPPQAIPLIQGSYYHVQPGETLWRIAHDFGVDVRALARVNRLPSTTDVKIGQRLFIPMPSGARDRFFWPARGRITRVAPRGSATPTALEIHAPEHSYVRAARSGRVAVAALQVQGLGPTVILDHEDGYVSVYAGLAQLLVSPGVEIEQGNPIGRLGREPLYFEIRYNSRPYDPSRVLP